MDELLSESRLSFSRLAQEQDISLPTVWRWSQRGIRGHVLESLTIGGRRYTTREAFARFIARTNGERVTHGRTQRQREAQQCAARRQLQEAGLID